MRSVSFIGRLCFRHGTQHLRSSFRPSHIPFTARPGFSSCKTRIPKNPIAGTILLSALSPAAFIKLSEDHGDGKTGEEHMLEASRAEIAKGTPDNVHGIRRAWKGLVYVVDQWIFEPIATSFRFLHLVVIFVPVIFAVPAMWIGSRQEARDHERSGTLWWYGFLVHSMERAGPAFIKVCTNSH